MLCERAAAIQGASRLFLISNADMQEQWQMIGVAPLVCSFFEGGPGLFAGVVEKPEKGEAVE